MRHRKAEDVKDIREAEITKSCTIGGKTVNFCLQNIFTGVVAGKNEVLDEILIDNMLEQMARAVKTNHSKYNQIPDEIIIRSGNVQEQEQAKEQKRKQENEAEDKTEPKMIESYEPRFALEQVALNEKVREQIKTAIAAVRYKSKMTEEWGILRSGTVLPYA